MMASTATAPMIFGTKLSVASLIWVAAWKMLTTRPITSTVIRIGADTMSSRIMPCWPVAKTCWASMADRASGGEARSERAEQQVPAVGEYEQHQLERQRHQHRAQHHHAQAHQHA